LQWMRSSELRQKWRNFISPFRPQMIYKKWYFYFYRVPLTAIIRAWNLIRNEKPIVLVSR
jgi:hypothetical protein